MGAALPRIALELSEVRAEVTALAAALCRLTVAGRDLTEPVAPDVVAPQGNGLVLAPWPNRVRDGRWSRRGVAQQLAITEPALGNASHGLLRNTGYRVVERTASSVELGALIAPQLGWPFAIDTRVTYRLEEDGLVVTHRAVAGSTGALWAVGAHPYFRVGAHPVGELTLTVTGDEWLATDDRLNALDVHPVDASNDLRSPRPLEGLDLNIAYTGLANREARATVAALEAPDGARTELWADPAFGWVQVYTPADHPRPDGGTGLAVALEPMTAPPDALNSGIGVAELAPGEAWEASWGIRAA